MKKYNVTFNDLKTSYFYQYSADLSLSKRKDKN